MKIIVDHPRVVKSSVEVKGSVRVGSSVDQS